MSAIDKVNLATVEKMWRREVEAAATYRHLANRERDLRRKEILIRLAEQEEIKAEDQEVDAEVERLAGSSGEQAHQLRTLFGSPDGRAALARSLVTRKTMDRLAEIASRDGATIPEKKSRKKTAKVAAK